MWSIRAGTWDKNLLLRTWAHTGGMEALKADALDESFATSMVRKSFNGTMPAALCPGNITSLDTFSISAADLPVGVEGGRLGFRYGMILVDAFSR